MRDSVEGGRKKKKEGREKTSREEKLWKEDGTPVELLDDIQRSLTKKGEWRETERKRTK